MASTKLLDFLLGCSGMVFDYAGSTAPSGFLLCYGQAVSRTTFAQLFTVIGTSYGVGDGSTTFNVPDLRGVVTAGVGNMGGTPSAKLGVTTTGTTTAASAVVTAIPTTVGLAVGMQAIGGALPAGVTIASIDSGTQVTLSTGVSVTAATAGAIRFCLIDSHTLGATGGTATHALATTQMPAHTHANTLSDPGHFHTNNANSANSSSSTGGGGFAIPATSGATVNSAITGISITNVSQGGGNAHPNLQPTIVLNRIIKT